MKNETSFQSSVHRGLNWQSHVVEAGGNPIERNHLNFHFPIIMIVVLINYRLCHTYLDLGTDVIRIMPLIKNCVLMVVNEIDPLGSSHITGKRFPLDSLEPCFFFFSICFHCLWQEHFPKGVPLFSLHF